MFRDTKINKSLSRHNPTDDLLTEDVQGYAREMFQPWS